MNATQNNELTVDTCYITELFLSRPTRFAGMSMGVWFDYCHELKDDDLQRSCSGQLTKKLIVEKGYNRLPLQVLIDHNRRAAR